MSDVNLARRAVACKAWRRMAGMRWVWAPGGLWPEGCGEAVRIVGADEWPSNASRKDAGPWQPGPESLPDLDDPATLGCLRDLAREAHCCPVWTVPCFDGWDARVGKDDHFIAETEAAALVAALEAAP